jgi:hypothetical protein
MALPLFGTKFSSNVAAMRALVQRWTFEDDERLKELVAKGASLVSSCSGIEAPASRSA